MRRPTIYTYSIYGTYEPVYYNAPHLSSDVPTEQLVYQRLSTSSDVTRHAITTNQRTISTYNANRRGSHMSDHITSSSRRAHERVNDDDDPYADYHAFLAQRANASARYTKAQLLEHGLPLPLPDAGRYTGREHAARKGTPPMTAEAYINEPATREYLDAARMRGVGAAVREREWRNRWTHLSNRAKRWPLAGVRVDMPWARTDCEARIIPYLDAGLTYLTAALARGERLDGAMATRVLPMELYTKLYYFGDNRGRHMKNRHFEARRRVKGELVSWHDVSVFRMSEASRRRLYGATRDVVDHEPATVLLVPNPLVAVYFSNLYLSATSEAERTAWQ